MILELTHYDINKNLFKQKKKIIKMHKPKLFIKHLLEWITI